MGAAAAAAADAAAGTAAGDAALERLQLHALEHHHDSDAGADDEGECEVGLEQHDRRIIGSPGSRR